MFFKNWLLPTNQHFEVPIAKGRKATAQRNSDFYLIVTTESLRLLLGHIKTIVTKYEQSLYRDDYGELKIDAANKQIDYFVRGCTR